MSEPAIIHRFGKNHEFACGNETWHVLFMQSASNIHVGVMQHCIVHKQDTIASIEI